MDTSVREKTVVQTSIIGVVANIVLALFKAAIGIITNSVAITMDAVNNTTDAASSIITIVGTKLAGKEPDKKHPFGYGRIEYLTAMVIAVLVTYAGVTALIESVQKIIEPEEVNYSTLSVIIVTVAVIVKLVLGIYVKKTGKRVKSESLVNSGQDALFDSILSAATVIAAILYISFGLSIEAYLGAVISVVIIKSGIDMLKETISHLLGETNDIAQVNKIKKLVRGFEGVRGVYDLVIYDYGPNTRLGSLHIEVPDVYTASEIDELTRQIQMKVYEEEEVLLTSVGVYSFNTTDKKAVEIREKVFGIAKKYEHIIGVHGFYYNKEQHSIRFDVIISFDAPDRRKVYDAIVDDVRELYPECELIIAMDTDFAEGSEE
ncbi:MAG: cation diffusion facilitator family transporter [Lachnospiraceae bacterium]|nr:cation diffusion facilitator family transporter [Lachnospiraceae bacterium]